MRKGLLLILVLCSAVVAFLAFSAYQQQPSNTSNTPQTVVREKSGDTQTAIDTSSWRRFTSADGRFSLLLPPELHQTYEYAPTQSGEPTQALEGVGGDPLTYDAVFATEEVSTWTDPLSGQPMSEPLYTFHINEYENIDRLSGDQWATELHQWVNQHSAVVVEQERIRSDVSGFYGVRQWIWWQGNPSEFSSFDLYVHAGDFIWQFDVWLNDDNPTSERFQRVRKSVEAMFASVEFAPTDVERITSAEEADGLHVRNRTVGYEIVFPSGWLMQTPVDPETLQLFDTRAQQADPSTLEMTQGMKVEIFTSDEASVQAAYEQDENGGVVDVPQQVAGTSALRYTGGSSIATENTVVDWDDVILHIVGYLPEEAFHAENLAVYDAIVGSLTATTERFR